MIGGAETLVNLLKDVNHGMFRITKSILREHGFPAPGKGIMMHVLRSPGATVSEISRGSGVAKSHISRTINLLSKCGLVEKRLDPEDQRLIRVYPTSEARAEFERAYEEMRRRVGAVISILPESKADALIEGLRLLQAALNDPVSEQTVGDNKE